VFDKVAYVLIVLFYVLLGLAILPGSLTTLTGRLIEPESLGFHILGFTGMAFILFFVVYWLKKRNVIKAGKSVDFLKAHIFLALSGAGLAIFHSTFKLASPNSRVLVGAMVLIVTSGVVGKYLFGIIMNLKNGAEVDLTAMKAELTSLLSNAETGLTAEQRSTLEAMLLPRPQEKPMGFFRGLIVVLARDLKISFVTVVKMASLFKGPAERVHLMNARKAARLDNRIKVLLLTKDLFSKWKKVHLPFTVVLLVALAIHIATQYIFGNVRLFGG